ncbi:SusE domain-containing protein [Pontibacter harenae]|uniref:SusE domain-containing protein n=1 Tax=Pontibacter harenae TaxID=2894083 RepID=UPI001E56DF61|nr:SusE domain-containing protein [Pontibacter harenae]MCC9166870.1 SusE domain-containing protein [Pontibacter harenae]
MKSFSIKNITLLSLVLILFSSCEKDEDRVVASSEGTGATISASANTLTLQKENAEDEAVVFNWTKADFGYSAAVTNTLQFALAGTDFAIPKEVNLEGGESAKTYSVIDLNALLLSMSLPTNTDSEVEVRLKSQIYNTDAIAPVYSNVVNLTVNPYPLISFVYVPGAYQGWTLATADSLISPTSNGIYTGVINFPAGATEFKITPAKNWDVAYGEAGDGAVSTSAEGNLSVPAAGMYRLTLNLNENTFTAAQYSWGIIGDATPSGWGADTDMTYNNGTQTWSITTELTPGVLKFRLNDDWGTNYGGSGGTLVQDGADIAIASAGTYTVTMDLVNNTYSIEQQ